MTMLIRCNGGERGLVPYFHPLGLMDEIEDFTRQMWSSWKPAYLPDTVLPLTDMYEEKDGLVLTTELPGIEQKDLDISLEGDMLTVKAEKKDEVANEKTHHARERFYGKYYRTMRLPYPVKEDGVSAILDNGVLKITLPKAEAVKAKKIAVKPLALKGEQKKNGKKTIKKAS
jgi:HSP20 family protein